VLIRFYALVLICFSLQACDHTREALGMSRKAPNEFTVMGGNSLPPLNVPPDFHLRPPSSAKQKPYGLESSQQEIERILISDGDNPTNESEGEQAFLMIAHAHEADQNIRKVIDIEDRAAQKQQLKKSSFLYKLLPWHQGENADVIDPVTEKELLEWREVKKNALPTKY
jgi:hypothetical protein